MINRFNSSGCLLLILLVGVTLVSPGVVAQESSEVTDIGSRRELFVDHFLLERMVGTRLQLHHPALAEAVLKVDQPWEGATGYGLNVIQDGETYHMYYQGHVPGTPFKEYTLYARSQDGIHWEKPILGLVPINGSRENNQIGTTDGKRLYPDGEPGVEVFIDRRPGVPQGERFKAFTLDESEKPIVRVHAWVSGNGTHFRPLKEAPILSTDIPNVFDGQETLFWSEAEQMYLIYTRYSASKDRKTLKRSVARLTSKDFLNWTEPVPMTFGDTGVIPADQHYNNQTFPYFRARHIYLALSARFMEGRQALSDEAARQAGVPEGRWQDCSETILMTTRGGSHYDRTFMEGLIRPGPGPLNWVTRTNYALGGVVQTGPGEISLYLNRQNYHATWHVRRYRLRLDGFASLHAPYKGGMALTKPIRFSGKELEINYSTSAAGSVRVEIQDSEGKPLPGYSAKECQEILGDEVERVVAWQGGSNLTALAGRPVRLRFVLKDADIYSFRFR